MKAIFRYAVLIGTLPGWHSLAAQFPWVSDFNGDGRADPVWHYKGNSIQAPINGVWYMTGTTITGGAGLVTSGDSNWSLVGTGKFHTGGDSNRDILWRHDTLALAAVWIMNGTQYQYSIVLPQDPGINWRIAATADFNEDGYTDILWDNKVTGDKVVWLMQGTTRLGNPITLAPNLPQWKVMLAGDFGSNLSSTPDGHPDTLLYSVDPYSGSGTMQIWHLRWNSGTGTIDILDQATCAQPEMDGDWQPLMAGDVNSDGLTDVIWHHATDGQTAVWYMNGAQSSNRTAAPFGVDEVDTDWRLIGQGNQDSTLRVDVVPIYVKWRLFASAGPGQSINLSWENAVPGAAYQIYRKLTSDPSWGSPIASTTANIYSDSLVSYGTHYDYKVTPNSVYFATVSATVANPSNQSPTLSRGRAIVIVDSTLAPSLTATLDQLRRDLVTDGWDVPNLVDLSSTVNFVVPRHVDYPDPPSRPDRYYYLNNNSANVQYTASLIQDWINPAIPNIAVLIGHVPVPYTGYAREDGHTCCYIPDDHGGAWSSDVVYATVNSVWPDFGGGQGQTTGCPYAQYQTDYTNCTWEENSNHAGGDGKADLDAAPGTIGTRIVDVAVGRIDFSRMDGFGPGGGSCDQGCEISLIQRYFDKVHRFRYNLTPYSGMPFSQQAAVMSFPWSVPGGDYPYSHWTGWSVQQAGSLYGANTVVIGDPYRQNQSKAFEFGFAGGFGRTDRVYDGTGFAYTTSLLASTSPEARIGFFALSGSYFVDFDKRADLMRATIATPNYGFAAIGWLQDQPNTINDWKIASLAIGEDLGTVQRRTLDSWNRSRLSSIMGDPSLRLYRVSPPANVNWNGSILSWTAASGTTYYVFGSNSPWLPFTGPLLTTAGGSCTPPSGYSHYMVRAVRLITTPASGTYWETSPGVVKP